MVDSVFEFAVGQSDTRRLMSELDFKQLSPEQESLLRGILSICRYFQQATRWNPPVSDDVFARQARDIAWKMDQLNRVSQ
jgi:hypothetical protein